MWVNTFPPISSNGAVLRFLHYGLDEGLSQSSVLALAQDNLGFLWVGTQDGLNRFDGYSFKVFRPDPRDPDTISGGEILSLSPAADGALWIGTNAGLNRYDPVTGKFRHWLHDDKDASSLSDNIVQAVSEDAYGRLWVGTRRGLDELAAGSGELRHVPMPDKLSGPPDSINALYEDGQGALWIATDEGLVRYSPTDGQFQRYQNVSGAEHSISDDVVTCIAADSRGLLWVGTSNGLNRLDPSTGEFESFAHSDSDADSLSDDYITSVYVDRSGQTWVGTRAGLDRFDAAHQQFIHYRNDPADPSSLSNDTIDSVYEDRGGMLWIGTNDGGLNEHDRGQDKFAYYRHINGDPNSLSSNVIFPIVPAGNGRMWIGTFDAGLNLFDPATGRAQHFQHDTADEQSLLSDTVVSLLLDKDKTLWIGTRLGMDRLLPGSPTFKHYVAKAGNPKSMPPGTVFAIYQDRQSNYWVGTAHGLRLFDPGTGEFTLLNARGPGSADLKDQPVRAIYQDRSGSVWIGTGTLGLFRLDPVTRQLEQYANDPARPNSLSSNTVMDIFEDSRGTLWIATFGGGLDRYVPAQDGFVQYRQAQGLPNDVVYGGVEDSHGDLWLSTNLGISRLDVARGTFVNFTAKDGLQSNEFDGSGFAKDADGRLYFGGIKGLTVFNPDDIQANPYVPPVVITSLTTQDGRPVAASNTAETLPEIVLAYPHDSFDLSFAALSFSQSARNQYKYMLQGLEHDWHSAGADHRGTYTNLPGGTYTLRVIGSNGDGLWNEAGASVKVRVIPPFWQTWGFRGLSGFVLFLAAFVAYRSRVRSIQSQKAALEQLVMERTQALKKQNLDLEALYSADEKMLRVLTQDEVLRALVDVAIDILQADKAAVFTCLHGDESYSLRVARGFESEHAASADFCTAQQALFNKVAQGEMLVVNDMADDDAWAQQAGPAAAALAAENARSALYLPIKVQNGVLGIFNVCSSSPGAFTEERQRLFAALVQRAALSIENGRLFEQTRNIAKLEERNRLAQELHDSAKQKAFAALAQLGAAKKLVHHNQGSAAEHLVEAEDIVSEVIHDLTYFIQQDSYPNALREKGLAAFLQEYASAWSSRSGIRLNVSIVGERRLPLQIEQALYRSVQEGLSNIARHSQATEADLGVVYEEQEMRIRIGDNGKGFDPAKTPDGLGLHLIHERVESIGGSVEIQSRPNGTLLTIRVPLAAPA